MPEQWTESRLDELSHRVEEGFKEVRADLRVVRVETKTEFTGLRSEISEKADGLDRRIDCLDEKFDAKIDALGAELHKKIDRLSYGLLFAAIAVIAALARSNVNFI